MPSSARATAQSPTRSNVTALFKAVPSTMEANSSSERTTDPVRRTFTPLSGVSTSLDAAFHIPRCRCLASRLQIAEVQNRLDVHKATKLRELRPAAEVISVETRERDGLPVRQGFQRICDRSERRIQIVQLGFPQAHTFERLRQRAKDAAQRRIHCQRSEEGS